MYSSRAENNGNQFKLSGAASYMERCLRQRYGRVVCQFPLTDCVKYVGHLTVVVVVDIH